MRAYIASTLLALACVLSIGGISRAADTKTVPNLEWGMSQSEVERRIKRQNKDAIVMETICEIPLGLDFFEGLPIFSRDTGLKMMKVYGYGPLYFKDDRLVAMREDIRYLDEFTALKERFPEGRYSMHQFPDEQEPRTVFLQKRGDEYAFTNRYFDLYRFDPNARREIIAGVQGSFCWHIKDASPNLERYPAEYADCVAKEPRMDTSLLEQDLERCKRYCTETPEQFSSAACVSHCEDAFARAQ